MINNSPPHLLIKQKQTTNLPIISKIFNSPTNANRAKIFQMNKINNSHDMGSYKSEQSININNRKIRYQIAQSQEAKNMKWEKLRHQQKVFDIDSNKGFRQQFLAEVRKLSDMVIIYDLNNKSKCKKNIKSRKLQIFEESSTQFYPNKKYRYQTLDDYCQNLPLKYMSKRKILPNMQEEEEEQKLQKFQQKQIQKNQSKRYIKLSKHKNINVQLYKDEKIINDLHQQIQLNCVPLSKSKSQNRPQIPTPSNIIIENLKNYIQQKNGKLLPQSQSGLQNCVQKRKHKIFFNKRFGQHQEPIISRGNNKKKKMQFAYVESMLKCNSIPRENKKDFYTINVNSNKDDTIQDKIQQTIKKNITINQYQHSNLIRKINLRRFQIIKSRHDRKNGQTHATSRVGNHQYKNNQIRRRNYTMDGSPQKNCVINKQLLEYIVGQKQSSTRQKEGKQALKNRRKHKQGQKVKITDKQKSSPENKDKYQNLILAESINQWPFKNTSSQHFNQYFYSQNLKKN